jgi:hypothetical protein
LNPGTMPKLLDMAIENPIIFRCRSHPRLNTLVEADPIEISVRIVDMGWLRPPNYGVKAPPNPCDDDCDARRVRAGGACRIGVMFVKMRVRLARRIDGDVR